MREQFQMNDAGHAVLPNGRTTDPAGPGRMAYIGTEANFIGFDAMIIPNDGRVALHAVLHFGWQGREEDVFYELVFHEDAVPALRAVIQNSAALLQSEGMPSDSNPSALLLLEKLAHELSYGLH